jgi:tocopherol O-methyltransferase
MIVPRTVQDAEAVARHYDSLDRFYRAIWGEHVHHGLWRTGREPPEEAVEALVAAVAERLQLEAGHKVCDVGCGYGGTARLLADRWDCHVVGLTLSSAQLAWAETARPRINPRLIRRDWLANDFPDASFDAVLSIESSEHMVDKDRFFAEVVRTLKAGGRFATCVWLSAEAPGRFAVKHLLEPICREGRLPSMGSESEYRSMMARAGLESIGFVDLSRQVRRTWALCLARAGKGLLSDRSYRAFLFDPQNSDRAFAITLLRILLAYWTGAMRYGLFWARKPKGAPG